MDIELNILQNWIQESDNIVFISGADLSAEAGFPAVSYTHLTLPTTSRV